jgi:hypothetical protein
MLVVLNYTTHTTILQKSCTYMQRDPCHGTQISERSRELPGLVNVYKKLWERSTIFNG